MDQNHKENLIHKADVLMEALPYIQQFRDSIAVIKFGGSAMEDRSLPPAPCAISSCSKPSA